MEMRRGGTCAVSEQQHNPSQWGNHMLYEREPIGWDELAISLPALPYPLLSMYRRSMQLPNAKCPPAVINGVLIE